MKNSNWKYLIVFILAIPVLQFVGKNLGRNSAIEQNEQEQKANVQTDMVQGIKAVVTVQDSENLTPERMDMNFLGNLENYTAERTKVNIKKAIESKGLSAGDLNIESESNYVESGGRKFAVIRHKGPGKLRSVIVLSIVGKEVKRVTCVSDTSDSISTTYGVCGEKIKETFGGFI